MPCKICGEEKSKDPSHPKDYICADCVKKTQKFAKIETISNETIDELLEEIKKIKKKQIV